MNLWHVFMWIVPIRGQYGYRATFDRWEVVEESIQLSGFTLKPSRVNAHDRNIYNAEGKEVGYVRMNPASTEAQLFVSELE
jgi:hypothetical protein